MEIAGKTLRRRVVTAAVVFVALVAYDVVTGSAVSWAINAVVPVLFFVVSVATDAALQRWLDGRE
ncbi:hypothetical protein B4589_008690 [Halolamina sp. CBA1230]|uniref:hypothetical protein n=1 Tax=Halolamina sp. CBA1230 TaxID=1853690 RepID=UPI0009A23D3A|nr:hypothetical protein [Halolamina sp. CBA1230]QKY20453.1 hypothetical protein B4589_008690 [Halolamina sp. CBA1230]